MCVDTIKDTSTPLWTTKHTARKIHIHRQAAKKSYTHDTNTSKIQVKQQNPKKRKWQPYPPFPSAFPFLWFICMRASICIRTSLLFHPHIYCHMYMYTCFDYSVITPYKPYTPIIISLCVFLLLQDGPVHTSGCLHHARQLN